MNTNHSETKNLTIGLLHYVKLLEIDFTLLSWITAITLFVLEAFIVAGNAFVIVVIALDPLKNIRRSPSNHLVLSLAVADLLVGATLCFFSGWWYIHYAAYKEDLFNATQQYAGLGQFELVAISTTNLLALGIDRLIAVKFPLRYSYTVTKRRVRIVIAFTWLYFLGLAVVLSIFPPNGTINQDFIFNCHGLVAFVGLVINCGIVVPSLRKQSDAMKHLCGSSNTLRNIVEREKKVTRGTVIITVVFIACFVPFFVYQILEYFCVICWINNLDAITVYRIVALLFVLLNSMVNPYIYAYRLPKYLQAFKHLGNKLFCRKSNVAPCAGLYRTQKELQIDASTCDSEREETKL